ncbi:forms aploid and binucleate cells 1c [Striga asiatica]|uniref:Forms aploid and binucleate cells 1c n=1 Tax=Striga asiatica TaxID=4170 RepID=A0A5A7PU06_STRAF|nr:forms aploid and binucleate cells 1c [Striga asiatica]
MAQSKTNPININPNTVPTRNGMWARGRKCVYRASFSLCNKYRASAFLNLFPTAQTASLKPGGNKVFPNRICGIKINKRPEFLPNTIMFSFVGTKPQFEKDETVVKTAKVNILRPFLRKTPRALRIRDR